MYSVFHSSEERVTCVMNASTGLGTYPFHSLMLLAPVSSNYTQFLARL